LGNGNTVVSWGDIGRIDEVDADGTIMWQAHAPSGAGLGYTHHVEALGGAP
jgi:hypothetical protein